jgi:predicted transcriptional regulator
VRTHALKVTATVRQVIALAEELSDDERRAVVEALSARLEFAKAVRAGLADVEVGRTHGHDEVMREARRRVPRAR